MLKEEWRSRSVLMIGLVQEGRRRRRRRKEKEKVSVCARSVDHTTVKTPRIRCKTKAQTKKCGWTRTGIPGFYRRIATTR